MIFQYGWEPILIMRILIGIKAMVVYITFFFTIPDLESHCVLLPKQKHSVHPSGLEL